MATRSMSLPETTTRLCSALTKSVKKRGLLNDSIGLLLQPLQMWFLLDGLVILRVTDYLTVPKAKLKAPTLALALAVLFEAAGFCLLQ